MGALAQSLPGTSPPLASLWEFLKHELAPYRGRTFVVARIVTASTFVMIVCMACRIPNGALAAIFTLLISRESLQGTARSAGTLVGSAALGGVYVIVTAMFVLGSPLLRFLWAAGTFFLVFYALSAVRNYNAVVVFGVLCVFTLPVWDRQIPSESKVEATLWAVGVMTLGSLATVALELAFAAFKRTGELEEALAVRLSSLEALLESLADGAEAAASARSGLERLASVGTSRARRIVHRAAYSAHEKQRLGAVVALTGRLVDLGVNLARLGASVPAGDRLLLRREARQIAEIRTAIVDGTRLNPVPPAVEGDAAPMSPVLVEIARTTSLVRDVLADAPSTAAYLPLAPGSTAPASWLAPGALTDPKHVKFALRGCLAAGLCYLIYKALFWPGLSISVVTCLLTALTTIGTSRQKQFLRFAGAVIGGVILGMGAQIFVLPKVDSIAAFAVLFAAVTAIAAWFSTASARLSYLGIQIAVGFDLVHLQEFKLQTSLAVARDRSLGVLLGLAMMWVAYDLLWSQPAAAEMRKDFVSGLRLLGQLAREPFSDDRHAALARGLDLHDSIAAQFDQVRAQADGVLFEFGPSRRHDLAWRERFRRWQPQLRTLLLMRMAALRYRLQLPGYELPEPVRIWSREYDRRSAALLDSAADQIEGRAGAAEPLGGELPAEMPPGAPAPFVRLFRGIDRVTESVAADMVREVYE